MTSMSRSNIDNLSFEEKYEVYQRALRNLNEKISDLQEELENEDLHEMKQKFLWELLDTPYEYLKRTSEYEEILRDKIDDLIEMRDDLINCWNRLNASCARSCSDTMH